MPFPFTFTADKKYTRQYIFTSVARNDASKTSEISRNQDRIHSSCADLQPVFLLCLAAMPDAPVHKSLQSCWQTLILQQLFRQTDITLTQCQLMC